MEHPTGSFHFGCPGHVNRRQFLAGCSACAAGLSVAGFGAKVAAAAAAGETAQPATCSARPRVRLVFSHVPPDRPSWPNIGYDYEARKNELMELFRKKCPNVEFLPATVQNAEQARKLIAEDKDIDGYLSYIVGIWTGAPAVLADSGKPTILVDDLYAGSGEFLIAYAGARRAGRKVVGVSSSSFDDVADAVRLIEVVRKLRDSHLLAYSTRDLEPAARQIKEVFGTTLVKGNNEELNDALDKADRAEADRIAEGWMRKAEKVVEPSADEIRKCARMYLGMRDLMDRHKARAITVDCLSLFYSDKLTAYPCLGFWQLNNDGYVGACEADTNSTITMLVMLYLTGRPGFISDPVIDTAKNQIIYAHCVAPSKVFGPQGPENTYHIRSHSEDRKGACIRSLMPLNEMTTTLLFRPDRGEMIIHQGKTVENVDEDKACRSKLAVEVPDARRLLAEWDQWGWHRVTFYGDLRNRVEDFCALAGVKVVREG